MSTVIGRDRELQQVTAFLDREEGGKRVLLIEGEPGIGKTTLWLAGRESALRQGYRVLACTAAATEAQLAFTALRDLLGPVFPEIADGLPVPQRRALEIMLLLEEPGGRAPEQDVLSVAFVTALGELAASSPTLIAVDDEQWLDPASRDVLAYAFRRFGADAVVALLARRTGEPEADSFVPIDLEALTVRKLSVGALGRILHGQLESSYTRPTLRRIHEASGGNPFYALELARALAPLGDHVRPGDALPVPGTLRDLVVGRLAELPLDTREALALAAALPRPSIAVIGAALERDAASSLEPAVRARVVHLDDGGAVRFDHPLFAAATYDLGLEARRALHGRLSEVVTDPEERARHVALAAAEPDEALAQILEDGARAAFARGSPAAAAELVAQARALTPEERGADLDRRTLAEVDYEFAAGETGEASALLDELLAEIPTGPDRARLLSRKARIFHFARDIDGSVDLLYAALAEAGADPALRTQIEEGLAWGLLLTRRDLEQALVHAESAVRQAESRGDSIALAEGLAVQALTAFVLGRDWEVAMERALSLEHLMLDLRVLRHPTFALGYCLGCADEIDRARDVFDELLGRAREHGDESSIPSILNHLALIECNAGRWPEADRIADEGYERALESGHLPTQVSVLAKKALIAARRGDTDSARELAERSLRLVGDEAVDPARPERAMARGGETALWTLGFIELSLGNVEQADRFLGPMCTALLRAGVAEPGEARCLPDEIEVLVALDRLDEAERLLERLEGWAARLNRPSAVAQARRGRGLLQDARGDHEGAMAALAAAAAVSANAPLPFEEARALLALGAQQRRARQRKAARETLQQGLALFEELGASIWIERTRAELASIGGRGAARDDLTTAERRVAELVAQGMTNKEAAAALVVSVHTVESALTQVYRKLGVRSRTEMARRLAGRS